jgi:hypothetical protein
MPAAGIGIGAGTCCRRMIEHKVTMWGLRALSPARIALALWLTAAQALAQAAGEAPARAPLACAVEASRYMKPAQLCGKLGQLLGRQVRLVADARKAGSGEALQILRDDVRWTLVLLKDGAVRAFTRVSVTDARGREATFFARAARSLLQTSPKPSEQCVRLDPSSENSARVTDLVYPWAELKPCVRRVVDVIDPWWSSPTR